MTGAKNFGRMKEVIALVEAAQKRGVEISADQYPYVASSTGLSQTIPPWAHEGGGAKLAERLKDPATRAKIRREMDDPHPDWENRLISAGTWHNVQLASIRGRLATTRSTKACASTTRRRRRARIRTSSSSTC